MTTTAKNRNWINFAFWIFSWHKKVVEPLTPYWRHFNLHFCRHYIPLAIFFTMGVPVLLSMAMGEYFNVAWNGNIYRYLLGLHIVWMVNSVAHLWGPKPYDKFVWRDSKFSMHDDKTLSAGIFLQPIRILWVSVRSAKDGTTIMWVSKCRLLEMQNFILCQLFSRF